MKILSEKVLTAPIRFVYSSSTKASCEIEDVFLKNVDPLNAGRL